MGLDITAYETVMLHKAITEWNEGACDEYEEVGAYLHKDHPTRTQGDDLVDGVYITSGERFGFRAGSYSGYNTWRGDLARLIGVKDKDVWEEHAVAPAFGELIHFSDCEGFIGPKTSAKLAKDFAEWQDRAESFAATMEQQAAKWWLGHYNEWRKAFEIAAKGGAVEFH